LFLFFTILPVKQKKVEKEDYKFCLKEKIYNHVPLGNYSYIMKTTPN